MSVPVYTPPAVVTEAAADIWAWYKALDQVDREKLNLVADELITRLKLKNPGAKLGRRGAVELVIKLFFFLE